MNKRIKKKIAKKALLKYGMWHLFKGKEGRTKYTIKDGTLYVDHEYTLRQSLKFIPITITVDKSFEETQYEESISNKNK